MSGIYTGDGGIYNDGGGEVLNEEPIRIYTNATVYLSKTLIRLDKPLTTSGTSDSYGMGICPDYQSVKTFADLINNDDEIEINFVGKITKVGTGRTFVFGTTSYFGNTSDVYEYTDACFEINNYDSSSWFKIFGNVPGSQFTFSYNSVVNINLLYKKESSTEIRFIGKYQGSEKSNSVVTLTAAQLARVCLPNFGLWNTSNGFKQGSEILPGSFIRINDSFVFGHE